MILSTLPELYCLIECWIKFLLKIRQRFHKVLVNVAENFGKYVAKIY